MACSVWHHGQVNRQASAIRVFKNDLTDSMNTPLMCFKCSNQQCLSGEDVSSEEEQKKFVWSSDRVCRCPFNAIYVDPTAKSKAYHCDLCGGDPQCVKLCSVGAISIVDD